MRAPHSRRRDALSDRGFSLVEVTLALGVAAFALLAIFGLLPVGLNSNNNAIEQTAAAGLASTVAADLRAAPASTSAVTSPLYGISVPAAGAATKYNIFLAEDGTKANSASDARYRANIWFYPPASSSVKYATVARILITWPAVADPTITKDPSNFSGSFETITALGRN